MLNRVINFLSGYLFNNLCIFACTTTDEEENEMKLGSPLLKIFEGNCTKTKAACALSETKVVEFQQKNCAAAAICQETNFEDSGRAQAQNFTSFLSKLFNAARLLR